MIGKNIWRKGYESTTMVDSVPTVYTGGGNVQNMPGKTKFMMEWGITYPFNSESFHYILN